MNTRLTQTETEQQIGVLKTEIGHIMQQLQNTPDTQISHLTQQLADKIHQLRLLRESQYTPHQRDLADWARDQNRQDTETTPSLEDMRWLWNQPHIDTYRLNKHHLWVFLELLLQYVETLENTNPGGNNQ